MNIEEKVKAIAQSDEFRAYTYVFEDWETADHVIDRVPLPAIINVCPLQGQIERKNGRWRDMEYINIAFIDKVERDADGTENAAVYIAGMIYGILQSCYNQIFGHTAIHSYTYHFTAA